MKSVSNLIDLLAALVGWPLVALAGASDPGETTRLSYSHCQDDGCERWAGEGTGRCKEHWQAFKERIAARREN